MIKSALKIKSILPDVKMLSLVTVVLGVMLTLILVFVNVWVSFFSMTLTLFVIVFYYYSIFVEVPTKTVDKDFDKTLEAIKSGNLDEILPYLYLDALELFRPFFQKNNSSINSSYFYEVLLYLNVTSNDDQIKFIKLLKHFLEQASRARLKELFYYAYKLTHDADALYIHIDSFIFALVKMYPELGKYLDTLWGIKSGDLLAIIQKRAILERTKSVYDPFDFKTPYIAPRGIAYSWFSGFTFYISKLGINIMDYLRKSKILYGLIHTDAIKKLIEVLLKTRNPNAFIVGASGVGKTAVVYGLAQRIVLGDVALPLRNKDIYLINPSKMLAYVSELGNIGTFLSLLEKELKHNPNTILFIDDIEVLLQSSVNQDLLVQLMAILTRYNIPLLATITPSALEKIKRAFPALFSNFEIILLKEPPKDEVLRVLLSELPRIKQEYNVVVPMQVLRQILVLGQRYLPSINDPKRAVMLLDKLVVKLSDSKEALVYLKSKIATEDFLRSVIKEITGIETVKGASGVNLLNLEQRIRKRYIDQEEAVKEVVNAILRSQLELSNPNRPIGVFLFLGPTGVGKTYLAKVAASELFGSAHNIVRVDLSQYKSPADIPLIFDILSKVRLSPFSLVLLDEFEKTHPEIHDIFMRMFDEGVLVGNDGEPIHFNNSLIVATSNIGSREILEFASDYAKMQRVIMQLLPRFLKPELINRFDATVVFKPLSKSDLVEVAKLLLGDFKELLEKKSIRLEWTQDDLIKIVDKAYNPLYGARPLRRFIDREVKTSIARYILEYKQRYNKLPSSIKLANII